MFVDVFFGYVEFLGYNSFGVVSICNIVMKVRSNGYK